MNSRLPAGSVSDAPVRAADPHISHVQAKVMPK